MPGARAGGGAHDRGWNDASRLPALRQSGEPTGGLAPHAADGPDGPMARAPDGSARPGPRGTGAAGHRGCEHGLQGSHNSFKFLPSFAPPEMALDLRHFRPLARSRSAGGGALGRSPVPPPTLRGRDDEVEPRGTRATNCLPPERVIRLPSSLSGWIQIGAWVCNAVVGQPTFPKMWP